MGPNPAWDLTYEVDQLLPGTTHRVRALPRRAGGKAANVAKVLRQLDADPHVLGPGGGDWADDYVRDLAAAGVRCTLSPTAYDIRTSITVVDHRDATVFNEPGPHLTLDDWDALTETFVGLLPQAPMVVLSGSQPPGFPQQAYRWLIDLAHRAGSAVVLDAGGVALTEALAAKPEVVKPNLAELEAHAGHALDTVQQVVAEAEKILSAGVGAIIVTMGAEGLVTLTAEGAYRAKGAKVLSGNPTGAGDALTAAVAAGLVRGQSWPQVIREAMAVAAATAGLPQAGETDLTVATELRDQVQVEELSWAW